MSSQFDCTVSANGDKVIKPNEKLVFNHSCNLLDNDGKYTIIFVSNFEYCGTRQKVKFMHYWNKDNFEGLKAIGKKYSQIDEYKHFSNYCLYKEMGLRKKAISEIELFINFVKNRTIREQRKIADELTSLSYNNKDIHQLINYNLQQFLIKIFKNWIKEDNCNLIPYRWLGYLCNNIKYFEEALKIDNTDTISIVESIIILINEIYFQTHHLSESKFIGDVGVAESNLNRVKALLENIEKKQSKSYLHLQYEYYRSLLKSWNEYSEIKRDESFPIWCEKKGKKYYFHNSYYYDK